MTDLSSSTRTFKDAGENLEKSGTKGHGYLDSTPGVAGFLLHQANSLATMASQEFDGVCDVTFAEG
jgi:hypothetical protein